MAGIQFSQPSALDPTKKTGLNIGVQIDGLDSQRTQAGLWTAEAFRSLKDWAYGIESQLSTATDNVFPEIAVLGVDGELIGWIGARDGFLGGWFKQLYVGGTFPGDAPLFADSNGNVIIGQNGSISVRDLGGNEVGWEGVRSDTPKAITAATNASPSVVTVTAHGYVNGDTVFIAGSTGNTAINGYRIVENVTANTFTLTDLSGTVINGNGAYGGGGTATRYFAGAWFQSFAIGGAGFETSKIRAFADGSVVVNASLVVDSNGVTTSINNATGGSAGVVGLRVKNDTPPSQDIMVTDTGFYLRASDQFSFIAQMNGAGDSGAVKVNNIGGTKSITLLIGGGSPSVSMFDTTTSRSLVLDTAVGMTIGSPSSIITLNSVGSLVKVLGVGTGQFVSISPNLVRVDSGGPFTILGPSTLTINASGGTVTLGPTSLSIVNGSNSTSHTATDFNVSNSSGTVVINTTNIKITGVGTGQNVSMTPNIVRVDSGVGATAVLGPTNLQFNGVQVLRPRITGWTTPTGTQNRSGYTVVSAATIDLSQALAALIADLTTHGIIGS